MNKLYFILISCFLSGSCFSHPVIDYIEHVNRDKIYKRLVSTPSPCDVVFNGRSGMFYISTLQFHDLFSAALNDEQCIKEYGGEALHALSIVGDVDSISKLLSKGVSVNDLGRGEGTALMTAAEAGQLAVMSYLIKAGVNSRFKTVDGWDALLSAINMEQCESVNYLLNVGFSIDSSAFSNGITARKFMGVKSMTCMGQSVSHREDDLPSKSP